MIGHVLCVKTPQNSVYQSQVGPSPSCQDLRAWCPLSHPVLSCVLAPNLPSSLLGFGEPRPSPPVQALLSLGDTLLCPCHLDSGLWVLSCVFLHGGNARSTLRIWALGFFPAGLLPCERASSSVSCLSSMFPRTFFPCTGTKWFRWLTSSLPTSSRLSK